MVEELAKLADKPTGCGEVVGHGCLFAWNFSVTRSTVLMEMVSRSRPNMMLSPH